MNNLKTAVKLIYCLALLCLAAMLVSVLSGAPQVMSATASFLGIMLLCTASLFGIISLVKGDIKTQELYGGIREGILTVAIFPISALVAKSFSAPLLGMLQAAVS